MMHKDLNANLDPHIRCKINENLREIRKGMHAESLEVQWSYKLI